MSTTELTPTPIEGELRILDTDLGARLGFERPEDIRKLINRHAEKLNKISILATVALIHQAAGRPARAYYLNRKQAIYITAKSETDIATDITIEIIEKFDAYERGTATVAPVVNLNDPATLRGLLLDYSEKMIVLQAENQVLLPKAEALDFLSLKHSDILMTEAAKVLEVGRTKLINYLSKSGWIFKRDKYWVPYTARCNSGHLRQKLATFTDPYTGIEQKRIQVGVTTKGLEYLTKARDAINAS